MPDYYRVRKNSIRNSWSFSFQKTNLLVISFNINSDWCYRLKAIAPNFSFFIFKLIYRTRPWTNSKSWKTWNRKWKTFPFASGFMQFQIKPRIAFKKFRMETKLNICHPYPLLSFNTHINDIIWEYGYKSFDLFRLIFFRQV